MALDLLTFSAHTFFVSSLLGALVGTGFYALFNMARTLSGPSDHEKLIHLIVEYRMHEVVDTDDSAAESRLHGRFLMGVSLLGPSAFLIAGLFVVPEHKIAAIIVFGAAWGVVSALASWEGWDMAAASRSTGMTMQLTGRARQRE